MSAQVAADLRAAVAVLERDGWTQLRSHCDGAHCAAGAIEAAVDPNWQTAEGWDADQNVRFGAAVALVEDQVLSNITVWNDRPDRTAAEVIDTLRAAADKAEAEAAAR